MQVYNSWKLSKQHATISGIFPNTHALLVGVASSPCHAKIAFAHGFHVILNTQPLDAAALDWLFFMRNLHSDVSSLCSEFHSIQRHEVESPNKDTCLAKALIINDYYLHSYINSSSSSVEDNTVIFACDSVDEVESKRVITKRFSIEFKSAAVSFTRYLFHSSRRVHC